MPAQRIPYAFARAHGVLPLRDEGDAVLVLARGDASVEGIAELKRVLQRPLKTLTVNAERFAAELATAYNQASAPVARISEDMSRDNDLARLLQDIPQAEDLLGSTSDAPVIRMINALLLQALRERASDIHFEPYDARSVVRFRVDGVLRHIIEPPRALHAALVSRIKVMASLDIAEKRLPQDGRMALKLGDKSVDVRVSTLPTGCAAPARQGYGVARLERAGHGARHARCGRPPGARAAWHRAGDRTDRLGQDDDLVRGHVTPAARGAQHHDRRRPDRVRARRRGADAGQSTDRAHVRAQLAVDPAPGP